MKYFQHLHLETDNDDVLWLTLDVVNSSCNTLHPAVLQELSHACMLSRKQQPSALVLRSAKPASFAVGLDATQLSDLKTPNQALEYSQLGQSVCQQFADLPFPTIALLNGICTGSGLELSLALDYRITQATTSLQVGFRTIQLGLHPYFGGIHRSIHKLGLHRAMELMLSPELLDTQTAKQIGLIQYIVPNHDIAVQIHRIINQASPPPAFSLSRFFTRFASFRKLLGYQLRHQFKKRQVHPAAPPATQCAIFNLWEQHGKAAECLYDAEAISFAQLLFTKVTQNFLRVRQLQARLQAFGALTPSAETTPFQHVHIIGRHQTGQILAEWCRQQNWHVTLQNVGNTADAMIEHADVIIDAINDNLAAKQQSCLQIEQLAKPSALLISITTTTLVEDIAAYMRQPQRLVGLHFSKILPNTKLVEVIFDPHDTDAAHITRVCQFIGALGKLPLPVKSSHGFLINRILLSYIYEGIRLHQQGIPANIIDQAARDFGLQFGPLELADTLGLAFCQQIGEVLEKKLRIELPLTFYHMIREGRTGKAAGHGFYKYRNGKVFNLSNESWQGNRQMLQERLVQQIIQSAYSCLASNVVSDQDLLDAGMIFGLGFAACRGGLLHYAQHK